MKFRAGDFSLDNAPQSGRPVEADSDQIETLIENNQHSTTQEIADILKIPKSIKLLVKMKNVSFILRKTKQTFWPAQYISCTQRALRNGSAEARAEAKCPRPLPPGVFSCPGTLKHPTVTHRRRTWVCLSIPAQPSPLLVYLGSLSLQNLFSLSPTLSIFLILT